MGKWLSLATGFFLVSFALAPAFAQDNKFSKQQLDQMLAPIALYPDDLLTNVLMASTYPLDVVQAARWRTDPETQSSEAMRWQKRWRRRIGTLASRPWCSSPRSFRQ